MVSSWISLNVEPRTYRTSRVWRWWWWWRWRGRRRISPNIAATLYLRSSLLRNCQIAQKVLGLLTWFLSFFLSVPLNVLLLFVFFPNFLILFIPPSPLSSSSSHSGRAHGAFAAALVDGDGLYSLGNGELRLARLPPLGHHHLLQGHQKVGFPLPTSSSFVLVLVGFRKQLPLNALLVI